MFVSNMDPMWVDLLSCCKGWRNLEGGVSLGPKYKRAGIPTEGVWGQTAGKTIAVGLGGPGVVK